MICGVVPAIKLCVTPHVGRTGKNLAACIEDVHKHIREYEWRGVGWGRPLSSAENYGPDFSCFFSAAPDFFFVGPGPSLLGIKVSPVGEVRSPCEKRILHPPGLPDTLKQGRFIGV